MTSTHPEPWTWIHDTAANVTLACGTCVEVDPHFVAHVSKLIHILWHMCQSWPHIQLGSQHLDFLLFSFRSIYNSFSCRPQHPTISIADINLLLLLLLSSYYCCYYWVVIIVVIIELLLLLLLLSSYYCCYSSKNEDIKDTLFKQMIKRNINWNYKHKIVMLLLFSQIIVVFIQFYYCLYYSPIILMIQFLFSFTALSS